MDPALIDQWIAKLVAEEAALLDRLLRVRVAKEALANMQRDEPVEFEGKLADAIRVVLKNHRGSLSPTEIRDKVKELGYNFEQHSNPMAAVHGVLRRLDDGGEVKTKEWKKSPGTRYYWADESIWTTAPSPNSVGAIAMGEVARSHMADFVKSYEESMRLMNDPALQKQMQQMMKEAKKLPPLPEIPADIRAIFDPPTDKK